MHATPEDSPTSGRVMSVDALRGFDMFWIVGGKGLAIAFIALLIDPIPDALAYQFTHTQWIGFTAWDLIMPLFLFVVGTSMPFSFTKRIERGESRGSLYRKISRRVVILFILGIIAQGHLLDFDFAKLHIYCNTLQAIACGYFIAGIIMLNLSIVKQVISAGALLVVYWLLMIFVPVPGQGAGNLEPDANLALYIDDAILGKFRDGTSYTWILSSLGFGATVLLGVLSGHLLRSGIRPWTKVAWLFVAGIACLILGWCWGNWLGFPIIKHIWTSSMVLWAGGWSLLLLAVFYAIVDVLHFHRWAFPAVVIGMNAITVYMAVDFVDFGSIGNNFVGGLARHLGTFGEFLLAFTSFMVMWLLLLYMYRKRTFLRI